METLDELFCVDDALGLDLIDIGLEHRLKGGTQRFLGELKLSQYLLHFNDCDTATPLRISFLQCVVQL